MGPAYHPGGVETAAVGQAQVKQARVGLMRGDGLDSRRDGRGDGRDAMTVCLEDGRERFTQDPVVVTQHKPHLPSSFPS
jgi:hypothetical protein